MICSHGTNVEIFQSEKIVVDWNALTVFLLVFPVVCSLLNVFSHTIFPRCQSHWFILPAPLKILFYQQRLRGWHMKVSSNINLLCSVWWKISYSSCSKGVSASNIPTLNYILKWAHPQSLFISTSEDTKYILRPKHERLDHHQWHFEWETETDLTSKKLLFVTNPLYKSQNPQPLSGVSQPVVNLSKCANTRGREELSVWKKQLIAG